MSYYERFRDTLTRYFADKGITFEIETTLKEASKNEQKDLTSFVYQGSADFNVISMDEIARRGYKTAKQVFGSDKLNLNTVDAFLISADNEWFFIEFKDCKLSSKKDNIEKKGMANWLMLQDIFFDMGQAACEGLIDLSNPCQFAREHITYIVVCSHEKDPYTWEQVRNMDRIRGHYTPECLFKFKNYFFKDAYAYTDEFFEHRFVKRFSFQ